MQSSLPFLRVFLLCALMFAACALQAQNYEYVPDATQEEIADRMSCIDTDIPIELNDKVYSFITYFTERDRGYTKMVQDRMDLYFPIFEHYLAKYDMPDEIKYLPIIESGLNPKAISRATAGGLWQFMPSTGRMYKLHQDFYIDERFDPYKATESACLYLKRLYGMFNDWELALAAYNCGPGNVRKAIRRSGYKDSFWEVYRYLPRETRSYVPQFVAMIYVMNYADFHNLPVNDRKKLPDWETVEVQQYLHLPTMASMLNLCEEELMVLNPAVKYKALPDGSDKAYPLRLPSQALEAFEAQREEILDSASKVGKKEIDYLARNTPGSTYGRNQVRYKVRSGDVLGVIAQRYGVRVSDIKSWNNLHSNTIRIGQTLNIWLLPGTAPRNPVPVARTTSTPSASTPVTIPPGAKTHTVQPGDTLWDIARMYDGLSVEKIKQLNNLKSNSLKPGMTLLIG